MLNTVHQPATDDILSSSQANNHCNEQSSGSICDKIHLQVVATRPRAEQGRRDSSDLIELSHNLDSAASAPGLSMHTFEHLYSTFFNCCGLILGILQNLLVAQSLVHFCKIGFYLDIIFMCYSACWTVLMSVEACGVLNEPTAPNTKCTHTKYTCTKQ